MQLLSRVKHLSLHASQLWHIHRAAFHISTICQRQLDKPPTFITTPIFYVNSVPHIGHLYTTVFADAIFRFSKLVNPTSEQIFSTGTDEHGLKVQRSSEAAKQDTLLYCDQVSNKFRNLFNLSNISYTVYNRTTDLRHKEAVQSLWTLLLNKGYIYKSSYKGYYSVSDESFVPENAIVTNSSGEKISAESGHPVEWYEEENYMFKLFSLQKKLEDYIHNQVIIKPENFHATLKSEMNIMKTLGDISISRSKARLKWGIEVPNDSSQVIYVWFDALINYLTASGYPNSIKQWPPCHVIGKDIIKFHAIYWPAFLIAADIQPPTLIYCHSHWLYEDQKMSKSRGNVVDPMECIQQFTSDGIRFFLLKEGSPQSDSNFSMDKVKICLNAELANTYGNLLNRCTSTKLNARQQFQYFDVDYIRKTLPDANEILEVAKTLANKCYHEYLMGNFYSGITQIMDFLRLVNGFITLTAPWTLKDSSMEQDRLNTILYVALESIRLSAILLEPIIPNTSKSVLDKLNVAPELRTWKSAENCFKERSQARIDISQQKYVLFSKLQ